MNRFSKGFIFLFLTVVSLNCTALAHASSPFSDSFDTYQQGSLYSQGLWQNNSHTWQVTSDGCYSGSCITSTGRNGGNTKVGTDLAAGEWRIRFYVSSDFSRSDLVPTILFGSSAIPSASQLSIVTDSPGFTTIHDNRGNPVGPAVGDGAWHSLVFKWNMSDTHNCTFALSIDDSVDVPYAPFFGTPSNCYSDVFSDHLVGSMTLSTYFVGAGQVFFDDIGDGPTVTGCLTNCTGNTASLVSDTFDQFNTQGWTSETKPNGSLNLFSAENASSGNCHSGNCLVANNLSVDISNAPSMYLESGVGKDSGAYTLWARARLGFRNASANFALCTSAWSNCYGPYARYFNNFAAQDDTWHQYYFAWRQGTTAVETCQMQDDSNSSDCLWFPSNFPKGTQFDGVQLSASVSRSDLGDQVWFDDLQDASTAPACTINCYSNVMFLPGIEASNLYTSGSLTENHIWPPNSVAGQDIASLDLTNPATANNVYTKEKDVIGMAYVTTRVYQPFIDQMNSLVSNNTIADWEPIAYDWRLNYDDLLTKGNDVNGKIYYRGTNAVTSTPYIIQELKRLATSSRTKKVTIIAHSNGGLLAKALIQYLGTTTASQLIDKLILVETPQVGTPQAIGVLLHGYQQGLPLNSLSIFLSPADARVFALTTPTAYNFLPTDQYFTFTDNAVITFNAQSLPEWIARYGDIQNPGAGIHSVTLLRTFMTDISRGAPNPNDIATPAIASTTLFDHATNVHSSLDAWVAPPSIQLVTIAGWGNETLSTIEYTKAVTGCALNTSSGCATPIYGNQITFNPHVVIDGDGTVVDSSAQWANGATSTRYWLNLEKYNCPTLLTCVPQSGPLSFLRTTHAFVFTVPQLNTFLSSLITNSTPASTDLITTTRPAYTGNEQRLHFVLHSPLTLGFSDNNGNYSGSTATSTIFNVPGVDYQRIGEVQWLSVPKGLAGKVVMHGTGSGFFTLGIESVNGNNILATTTFAAVPSATSTIATLLVDPAVDPAIHSTLQVDGNGDGIIDRTLQTRQGGTVLPDVTAPEAIISVSTSTKDLLITGVDDVSPTTTVTKTATSTTVADQSGNKTTLFFQKTYSSNLLTYARLTGISYGTTTTALPSSFVYVWDVSKILISQTVLVDNTFAIQALYNKTQNKTTILVLKKDVPIQTTTTTGLAIIKLTTTKGVIHYSW